MGQGHRSHGSPSSPGQAHRLCQRQLWRCSFTGSPGGGSHPGAIWGPWAIRFALLCCCSKPGQFQKASLERIKERGVICREIWARQDARLWYGKAPEDFNERMLLYGGNRGRLQKRELLGGRDDAKTIARQLAEGRAQVRPCFSACWQPRATQSGRLPTSINLSFPRLRPTAKKPDEARDKILSLMGDLPRVELFARQTPPGWAVWGNEVTPTIPDFGTHCPEVQKGV